jgi:hypothetical protein
MKKATKLLLSLILLIPLCSFSPSEKAARDSFKYVFAYSVKPSAISPGQYDITCYFLLFNLGNNTWTNPPAPASFTISPNSGPLVGNSVVFPQGQNNYTFISLPWEPMGQISCTITPVAINGIPVHQTAIPVSEL